jgi:uncharacterized phage-associated protein
MRHYGAVTRKAMRCRSSGRMLVDNDQAKDQRAEVEKTLLANDVASVILARSGGLMDAMSLQKLLYYVQAWHLAITDEPLFPEQIKAWRKGPVVPQVWHERKDRDSRRAAAQDVENLPLDDMTSDLIDLVLASYGSMSGEELSALTHVEQPWMEARQGLAPDADGHRPINVESMAKYYRANRRLDGHTAADLAAGGIHARGSRESGPVDIATILDSLGDEYNDPGEDPWGGANLDLGERFSSDGIIQEPGRISAD